MLTLLEHGFVFDDNRPTSSCHASTVVKTSQGILSAWFGGTQESAPDVDIYLTRLSDGRLLLVSNPVGQNGGKRTPHALSLSEDNGRTFHRFLDLESDDDPSGERSCEFSYPAVISVGDRVYITDTYRREKIAYAILGE